MGTRRPRDFLVRLGTGTGCGARRREFRCGPVKLVSAEPGESGADSSKDVSGPGSDDGGAKDVEAELDAVAVRLIPLDLCGGEGSSDSGSVLSPESRFASDFRRLVERVPV